MFNPYVPYPVTIAMVRVETEDQMLKSFQLHFMKEEDAKAYAYIPGQFGELSISGYGEIPIGIASSPTEGDDLLFTVNKVGHVTKKLHNMREGDVMGVRGPLGNWYPFEQMKGKDIVIAAGGYAVTTLRSTMIYLLDPKNRGDYGQDHLCVRGPHPGYAPI
jgi:sulfhydrogenase subunit gamma (sulfur reductase)